MLRRPRLRRMLGAAALALVAIPAAVAAVAAVESSSGDSSVVLVNTKDGKHEARAGFSLKQTSSDVIDNANGAAAVSSGCTGCRTVATAVQIVLVEGNPSTVTPTNLAIAINQDCTECESAAFAYQKVLSTNGNVRITEAGHRRMADIEAQIRSVTESSLPFPEMDAQLDALVAQLFAVVEQEIVPVGKDRELEDEDFEATDDAPVVGPTPSPDPSASLESPSPSPTASLDASSSPEPTASPTPTSSTDPCPSPVPSPTPTASPTAGESPCPTTSPSPSATEAVSPTTDQTASPSG